MQSAQLLQLYAEKRTFNISTFLLGFGNIIAIKGKRIIVAGGAGFIGSNLVERLANGDEVTVIDNMHAGSLENLKEAMADLGTGIKLLNDYYA